MRGPFSVEELVERADKAKRLAEYYEERATRLDGKFKTFAEEDAREQRQYERQWRAGAIEAAKRVSV